MLVCYLLLGWCLFVLSVDGCMLVVVVVEFVVCGFGLMCISVFEYFGGLFE